MAVILKELIEAARADDRERFDRLYDLWFTAVYALAMQRVQGDRARAERLTQRVLLGSLDRESTNAARKQAETR